MRQFAVGKQINNNPTSTNSHNKNVRNLYSRKIPMIGHKEIPTHTFHKTFYHHKQNRPELHAQNIYFSHSKEYTEKQEGHNHNRPIHLLKKYLLRKQKLAYPLPTTNKSEPNPQKSIQYRTMNEFRIKKSKRLLQLTPNVPDILALSQPHNKQQPLDDDFVNFNASKNLYSMTFQELQESIRWKKQFLDLLNTKMGNANKTSYRIKKFA